MAVKLIIDSASDITPAKAKEMGIIHVPMSITFGQTQYLDGVELDPKRFYELLIETDTLPKTAQISPYTFEQEFEKVIAQGDTPIAITISSKLSGTYQSACIAAEKFEGKAFAVDSLNAALGEAILIYWAAELIERGLEADKIVDELNAAKTKIKLIALLDTLEYLKKGGRISSATAFAGELLSIKPVISVIDGEVKPIGKARGSKKGNNLLMELVEKSGGIDFDMPYTLAYSGTSDSMLKKYIEDSARLWQGKTENLPVLEIGATIGTHVGPGAIAVAFFEK